MRMRCCWSGGSAALVALLTFLAPPIEAQTGTLTGRVVDAETGAAVRNAGVEVLGSGGERAADGLTGNEGQFRFTVPAGTYALVVSIIGYETQRVEPLRVGPGATETVSVALRSRALLLNPIVATVGRGVEQKAVEAPASVSVVSEEQIRVRPAATPVEHLRGVPGVDIATHGHQSGRIVARGFNSTFNWDLHTLTDHRIAGVPSLRVNALNLVPATDEDIERIEVVLGPGSALYGPNTANGVAHFLTRSPLAHQGTTFSVAGGERSLFHAVGRTSQLVGESFGIKASGQYLRANEWEYTDPVEQAARAEALQQNPDTRIGLRDFDIERWSAEVRADWRIDDETDAVFQVGRSTLERGIELTGVGAAQVEGWAYTYYQARANRDRLFGQAYLNTSDAGDTFTLREGDPIVDRSKLFVAQLQHGLDFAQGRQSFTYGADYIRTMPDTRGTIHGRFEDEDQYDEYGGYLQSETSLTDRLSLVAAGRLDWHSELPDPVFSPRAALVFNPAEGQSVRATYNRAFSTPASVHLFLDINAGPFPEPTLAGLGYGLRGQGTAGGGFTFRSPDGSLTGMRSPFNPAGGHVVMPAHVPTMWQMAVGVLASPALPGGPAIDPQTAAFLLQQTPGAGQVGIAYLDVLEGGLPVPLTPDVSFDVPPLVETSTTTWEVGYKGLLRDRVLLATDVWYSEVENFISSLQITTPLLFLDGQSLAAHLGQPLVQHLIFEQGYAPAEAQQRAMEIIAGTGSAPGLASLPIGVLGSEDFASAQGRSDFLVSYRNFGRVTLWGTDLSAQVLLDDRWRVELAGSWVSRDHFETEEGQTVALNAPTTKLSGALQYRDALRGWNAELRTRYNNGFPVLSAPFVATACLGETGPLVEPCVESFTLVDLLAGYRLPWAPGASVQLSVQNVLDTGYRSYAGVPEIGRIALLRLRYEF